MGKGLKLDSYTAYVIRPSEKAPENEKLKI